MNTAAAAAPLRHRRFAGWDYAKGASLFVTIATEPRRAILGRVVGDKVVLSALGAIVREALDAIARLNPGIRLFSSVVMPDHIHFNINIAPGLPEPLITLGRAISRFKNYTTKQAKLLGLVPLHLAAQGLAAHSAAIFTTFTRPGDIGTAASAIGSGDGRAVPGQDAARSGDGRAVPGQYSGAGLWQRGYHDRLCLSRRTIAATERYIAYNPLKWTLMHGSSAALRIREPLSSPRLDIGDYWKGVGNTALLDPALNIASLRVSRKVRDIPAVVARIESAVSKGWVILSGFISPGEKAVLEMLSRRSDARFIRILPSSIPNARYKPDSILVEPFNDNRFLEIAEGNDEVSFDRNACLHLNDEIIEIATSTSGLALYFTEYGLKVLKRSQNPTPAHQ